MRDAIVPKRPPAPRDRTPCFWRQLRYAASVVEAVKRLLEDEPPQPPTLVATAMATIAITAAERAPVMIFRTADTGPDATTPPAARGLVRGLGYQADTN